MRDSSPHCGTGVLARRFAFAGLKFLEVCRGLSQSNGRGFPFLHSIRRTANEHEHEHEFEFEFEFEFDD
jgi:hypothetical protein